MRLSANCISPDHHPIVNFIDAITINNVPVKYCSSVDTSKGEAVCYDQPMKSSNGKEADTHVVNGVIKIVWKHVKEADMGLFLLYKADWEQRETKRMESTQ